LKLGSNVLDVIQKCRECWEVWRKKDDVLESVSGLECVDRFCYLGDIIESGRGCEEGSRTGVKCAWGKFRELLPILTGRGFSARLKGKIWQACVQSMMVYGSETWAVREEDMKRLERAENMMRRWMCNVTLKDRKSSKELRERLGVKWVRDVVRCGR